MGRGKIEGPAALISLAVRLSTPHESEGFQSQIISAKDSKVISDSSKTGEDGDLQDNVVPHEGLILPVQCQQWRNIC